MNGDEVVGKADIRENEYYYFNVLKDKDFLGWDADSDGSADYAGLDMANMIAVSGDMIFNAVYGDIFVVRYFRIGYDSGEYEYLYFEEDWDTGEVYLCVYLNNDTSITAVWEKCTEHSYINDKCENCGAPDFSFVKDRAFCTLVSF